MQTSAIRLLAAPVVQSPETAVVRAGLLRTDRVALPAHSHPTKTRIATRAASDDYIWTASAGTDGSFNFYALPKGAGRQSKTASQWDGQFTSDAAWQTRTLREAAIQYAMQVNFSGGATAGSGGLVNLYA